MKAAATTNTATADKARIECARFKTQRDLLLKAVMLAVINIDCERNGLTPDGNVRERLVAAIREVEK